jgi:hypothetical protein
LIEFKNKIKENINNAKDSYYNKKMDFYNSKIELLQSKLNANDLPDKDIEVVDLGEEGPRLSA